MQIGHTALLCALFWHSYTTLIFAWNLRVFKALSRRKPTADPFISVCVPARNEELSIGTCVHSLLDQTYARYEVMVLNDRSEDATGQILGRFVDDRLTVIHGIEKPADWLGKPWACKQLADRAKGDILLFVDADTWLSKDALERTASAFDTDQTDMATIWPMQKTVGFWENVVVPMVYFSLFTLLPVRYVSDDPKWLPRSLRARFRPMFAAACGQFIAIRRGMYDIIGGHEAVKSDIVEDVALSKAVKAASGSVRMFHGAETVGCRMYRSHSEIWNGFRKNFLAGFGYNIPFFTVAALIHVVAYLLPFAALGTHPRLAVILILIPVVQRVVLAKWYGWKPVYALTHALGVVWFQVLGIRVLADRIFRTKMQWKGRTV